MDTRRKPPLAGNGSSGGQSSSGGGGPVPERVTVALAPKTVLALEKLTQLTGDNKTDSINKALSFYAYVQELFASGGALFEREPGSNEAVRLRVF